MKKHLDLRNNKVLFGLISLLFVMSIVQTSAILKGQRAQSPRQQAQVATSTSCLSVSNPYNTVFSNPLDPNQPSDYGFNVNVDITNNCLRPVNIIDPASLNSWNSKTGVLNTVSYMGIDYLGSNDGPTAITLPTNDYQVQPYVEIMSCMNCPQGAMQYRPSPLGVSPYQGGTAVRAYSLPVGQTKRFVMAIDVGVGHSSTFNWWLRAKPIRIKWFANTAYADNNVTANEITTQTLTTGQQNSFATDYVNISQDGADGSACSNGLSLGFNDTFEPVCE